MATQTIAAITGATNASPIVIQTALPHGFATGDMVAVMGVLGNTAANSPAGGTWTIAVTDATHFSLNGSTGSGTFTPTLTAIAIDFGSTAPATVPAPATGSLGYDLWCVQDLDPGLVEVGGTLVLLQALARRIITPRGRLVDDPNYGYDVSGFLNDDLSAADLASIGSGVDAEFLKDERVLRSSTTATLAATGVLTIASLITTSTTTFQLVLAVTSVGVSILKPST